MKLYYDEERNCYWRFLFGHKYVTHDFDKYDDFGESKRKELSNPNLNYVIVKRSMDGNAYGHLETLPRIRVSSDSSFRISDP